MHKIIFKGRASKELHQLPPPHFRRVEQAIDSLAQNPRPSGVKKLSGDLGYRIRIGNYRVIYDIDDTGQVVTIKRVKHRREVYR